MFQQRNMNAMLAPEAERRPLKGRLSRFEALI
jgi:hypothetical protein